jgi:nitroreductase
MDALKALKTRRSIRAYRPDPVPAAMLDDILDCGRLAATARNLQPWEFVVVTDPSLRYRLADLIETGRFIADAPVCIVVFCRETKYWLEDGCAAIQNMLVAARAHGLGSCWVAGEKKPYVGQVAELLGVPAGVKLVGLIALGYAAGSAESPPKRPLAEIVHREKW